MPAKHEIDHAMDLIFKGIFYAERGQLLQYCVTSYPSMPKGDVDQSSLLSNMFALTLIVNRNLR